MGGDEVYWVEGWSGDFGVLDLSAEYELAFLELDKGVACKAYCQNKEGEETTCGVLCEN